MQEQAPASRTALKALVAAGAALALTVSPMSVGPASAGFFDKTPVKVERGATSDFPSNEGTGNSVGNNQGVRGSANSGTPLGEGAGSNLVGNNQATRNNTSGTPFGEGSKSGSGVNLSAPDVSGIAEDAKSKLPNISTPNPLKDIGNLNPFQSSNAPDVSGAVSDAKNAASDVAEDVKGKTNSNPLKDIGNLNPFKGSDVSDVAGAAGDAKNAASNVASDVKSQAMNNPIADGAKTLLNKGAGVPNPQLNPIEDGKQLLDKNSVGSIGDAQSAAGDVASDVKGKVMNNPIADGAKTILNKVVGVPEPQLNPIEDGKQLINKNTGN